MKIKFKYTDFLFATLREMLENRIGCRTKYLAFFILPLLYLDEDEDALCLGFGWLWWLVQIDFLKETRRPL